MNDKRDDERSATVIPWPGPKPPEPSPSPDPSPEPTEVPPVPGDEEPPGTPGDALAETDAMTLDAFEQAVRRAVEDKLGLDGAPVGRPRGAAGVAQVFSALSGKDAVTSLAEVRSRLAAGPDADDDDGPGGELIDLQSVRAARQKAATETTQRLGGALKDTFNQFLAGLATQQRTTEIVLDQQFLKEHGPSLLGNLFQGLASALMQSARGTVQASSGAPAPDASKDEDPRTPGAAQDATPTPTDPAAPPATPVPPAQVQVRLDIGSILGGLFRRRATEPPKAPSPAPTPAPTDEPPKT